MEVRRFPQRFTPRLQLAGGVLGALGGAGLARGYNMVRGIDAITVTWTDAVMNRLIQSALLTYLAVAHYGRGRGEWAQSEHPAHWEKTVTDAPGVNSKVS